MGEAGKNYDVLASTNVQTPLASWVNIGVMESLTNGPLRYRDTDATNLVRRFYRARQQ